MGSWTGTLVEGRYIDSYDNRIPFVKASIGPGPASGKPHSRIMEQQVHRRRMGMEGRRVRSSDRGWETPGRVSDVKEHYVQDGGAYTKTLSMNTLI